MSAYKAIFTTLGLARLAAATATSTPIVFDEMAIGDGSGAPTTPSAGQTELVNEVERVDVNLIELDPSDEDTVRVEAFLPPETGGYTIREIGLYADGDLIAVASYPPIAKPVLADGVSVAEYIRILLVYSNPTDAITLTTDLSVVLATRLYVDDQDAIERAYVDAEFLSAKERWIGTEGAAMPSSGWSLVDSGAGTYQAYEFASGTVGLYFNLPLAYGALRYEKLTGASVRILKAGSTTSTVTIYRMSNLGNTSLPALSSIGSQTSTTAGHQLITVSGLTGQPTDDATYVVAITGGDAGDRVYGVKTATIGTEV